MIGKKCTNFTSSALKLNFNLKNFVSGLKLKGNTKNYASIRHCTCTSHLPSIKPYTEIPGPSGPPYIGSVYMYLKGDWNVFKYDEIIKDNFKKYGSIYKETLAGKTKVHICEPEMVRAVYEDEGKFPTILPFMEASATFRRTRDMSCGLENLNGEEWHKLRSPVQKHMMKPIEVSSYLPMTNEVADDFVRCLMKVKNWDNFISESSKWSLETSGYYCFGKRMGYLEPGTDSEKEALELIRLKEDIFTSSTVLKFALPFFKYIKSPTCNKYMTAENSLAEIVHTHFMQTVNKIYDLAKEKTQTSGKITNYQYVAYLISSLNLQDSEIILHAMFADGVRSTAACLVSILHCIASSQDIQQQLFEEVNSVLGDRSEVTSSDLAKLTYLKACVKEALRLFPITLDIVRLNNNNLVLGGYDIPSGSTIEINTFALFDRSDYFENPGSFLPERWLRDSGNILADPNVFLPFGRGPRMCIGRRFAEQDIYVMFSKIIQNFKIFWRGETYHQNYKLTMYPACDTPFLFEPRN